MSFLNFNETEINSNRNKSFSVRALGSYKAAFITLGTAC